MFVLCDLAFCIKANMDFFFVFMKLKILMSANVSFHLRYNILQYQTRL